MDTSHPLHPPAPAVALTELPHGVVGPAAPDRLRAGDGSSGSTGSSRLRLVPGPTGSDVRRAERGQATAEYALVMLAAAAIAGLLLAWAASTDGVSRLLNAVIDSILSRAAA